MAFSLPDGAIGAMAGGIYGATVAGVKAVGVTAVAGAKVAAGAKARLGGKAGLGIKVPGRNGVITNPFAIFRSMRPVFPGRIFFA